MLITIAARLMPYSHRPGTRLIIPGGTLGVDVFPALLRFYDLSASTPKAVGEFPLNITGPVEGFTAQVDLEHGCIKVWGHAASGYFRYGLFSTSNGGVLFDPEKLSTHAKAVIVGDGIDSIYTPTDHERLSFGSHKAQEWPRVSERLALDEIFPAWFRLGRLLPASRPSLGSGTTKLLQDCADCIASNRRDELSSGFKTLYRAGFDGILAPRLSDSDHQGLALPSPQTEESPMALLDQGSRLIRSLFFRNFDREIFLLPCVPQELHCGRFIGVQCGNSSLDIEWSKRLLRRIVFRCRETGSWLLHVNKDLHQFRLRDGNKDRGRIVTCGAAVDLLAGRDYFFDNFQK